MPRRSCRQQQAGYYKDDGTPTVSYKETLSTVFRKRRNSRADRQHQDVKEDVYNDTTEDLYDGPSRRSVSTTRHVPMAVICSLLVLSLVYVLADVKMQLKEAQEELWSFRQRMDTLAPPADTIPNFAMESQGARVQQHLSSDTYWPYEDAGPMTGLFCRHFRFGIQQRVIQGHSSLRPGDCWCFSGDRGHLFVTLSHPVAVTHVTLGHISKKQSPTGSIASAPREFSVYGVKTVNDEGTFLGTLTYDQDGAAFQTLPLNNPDGVVFGHVRLQVESNWGNPQHTCLYSFRVHGKLPTKHPF